MIIREILKDPLKELARFDFFNDYKDTRFWLIHHSDADLSVVQLLDAGHAFWLRKWQGVQPTQIAKSPLTPNDYRGAHTASLQGREFQAWPMIGYSSIEPLPFLHGRKWDAIALAYVHALRPSHIRVHQGIVQLNSKCWRVSVHLEHDNHTIRSIRQEVEVGLTDEFTSGHELEMALKSTGPKAP